jgi:hypothetical protein
MDNLSTLLSSGNLNNAIIEIDNHICALCEWGEKLDNLTDQQRNFYYNQELEREVNNGGFLQYFFNPSGQLCAQNDTVIEVNWRLQNSRTITGSYCSIRGQERSGRLV